MVGLGCRHAQGWVEAVSVCLPWTSRMSCSAEVEVDADPDVFVVAGVRNGRGVQRRRLVRWLHGRSVRYSRFELREGDLGLLLSYTSCLR